MLDKLGMPPRVPQKSDDKDGTDPKVNDEGAAASKSFLKRFGLAITGSSFFSLILLLAKGTAFTAGITATVLSLCESKSISKLGLWACRLVNAAPTVDAFNPRSFDPADRVPPRLSVQQIGGDIIKMEACRAAWNTRLERLGIAKGVDVVDYFMQSPKGRPAYLDSIPGDKYSYSSAVLPGVDICGWYFIPSGTASNSNILGPIVARAQSDAIEKSMADFQTAADEIIPLIPSDDVSTVAAPTRPRSQFDHNFEIAIATYEKNTARATATIAKLEGGKLAIVAGRPITQPPSQNVGDAEKPNGFRDVLMGVSDEGWDLRKKVSEDMAVFDLE